MKYKYAIGLHNNARAFVESAVDYAKQDYRSQWKFAILHLTVALELPLKARLATEDHTYLIAGNATVTERQFDEGDFKSVGVDECLERLNRSCGYSLSDRRRQIIKTLSNHRNRLAHYFDPSGDTAAYKAAAAAGLNLFIEINDSEFQDEDPYGARPLSQLIVELHKYQDFVRERLSSLSERLHSSVRPGTTIPMNARTAYRTPQSSQGTKCNACFVVALLQFTSTPSSSRTMNRLRIVQSVVVDQFRATRGTIVTQHTNASAVATSEGRD